MTEPDAMFAPVPPPTTGAANRPIPPTLRAGRYSLLIGGLLGILVALAGGVAAAVLRTAQVTSGFRDETFTTDITAWGTADGGRYNYPLMMACTALGLLLFMLGYVGQIVHDSRD